MLDIRTLALILGGLFALGAAALFLLHRRHRTIAGPFEWSLGTLLISVGFLLILTRGTIPPFVSIVIANLLTLLGVQLYYVGMCKFTEHPPAYRLLALIILVTWGPFLYLYHAPAYLSERIVLSALGTGASFAMAAAVLWRWRAENILSARIAAVIFSADAIVNGLRIMGVLFSTSADGLMSRGGAGTDIYYIWNINIFFVSVITFVMMIAERLNNHLQRNNVELTLIHKRDHQIIQEQNNFLAMVSHEFNNPLSSIRASSDVIDLFSKQQKEIRQETKRIKQTVGRLSTLVDACLTENNHYLDGKSLSLQPLNLYSLVSDLSHEHNISLTGNLPNPTYCSLDPYLFPVTLTNLIHNALKHCKHQDAVTLEVNLQGSQLVIAVEDDGPGVSSCEKEQIFQRFYRTESQHGGMGLGLYFVQQIIALHNGTIKVTTARQGGARFEITLPVEEEK